MIILMEHVRKNRYISKEELADDPLYLTPSPKLRFSIQYGDEKSTYAIII